MNTATTFTYDAYRQAFSQIRVPVRFPASPPNLEPRDDIWPTDKGPVIRRLEDGSNEFTELRWGFPPGHIQGIWFRVPSRILRCSSGSAVASLCRRCSEWCYRRFASIAYIVAKQVLRLEREANSCSKCSSRNG